MKIDESLNNVMMKIDENNVMMKIDENNVTKYQRESVLFAGEKINIEMHFDRIDEDPCINCCYRKICCYRMYFKVIDDMISAEINCDDGYRPIGEYIYSQRIHLILIMLKTKSRIF